MWGPGDPQICIVLVKIAWRHREARFLNGVLNDAVVSSLADCSSPCGDVNE